MVSTVTEKIIFIFKYQTNFTVSTMCSFNVYLLVCMELQFKEILVVVTSLKYWASSLNYVLGSK